MKYTALIFLFLLSCSTKKEVLLIQDINERNDYSVIFKDVKIKPHDILRIKVSTKSPEITALFSFSEAENSSSNLQSYQITGYKVDSMGFVNIPLLNHVKVSGLTLKQASDLIQNILKEQEDINKASVDIKIVNSHFTILGEVNSPGRYNFINNNIDIFQAIGFAGDLTINGKRNDIKILRKTSDKLKIINVDLTSLKSIIDDSFQIFSGDIIIVNPNTARVKNAGIIGNSGNVLSVLSFILSSLILITNN